MGCDRLVFDSGCGLCCLAGGIGMGYWYVSRELRFHHSTESPAIFFLRFQLEFIGFFFLSSCMRFFWAFTVQNLFLNRIAH